MTADWSVRLSNPGGEVLALALALCFVVIVALGVRQALAAPPHRRVLLVSLRVASGLLALFVGLQPQWVGERIKSVEGRVAVLLDASRSMSIRDGDQSRAARGLSLLTRYAADKTLSPVYYIFGDEPERADPEQLSEAAVSREDDTRIARALEQVAEQHGEELGAIVLLSDGADHSPGWSPAQSRNLGVRVHTVALAEDKRIPDEGIVRVQADPVAFLRQSAEVEVKVRSTISRGKPLVLTLRHQGQVVSEAEVELDAEGNGEVVLPFTPMRVGRAVYSLSLPVAAKDAVPENNERAFLVRVTRDKLRVLLVCGAPSWDTRFLRAFLKADPSIDLITFFILRTSNDLTMAPPEELSLIPFPTDELFREHLESFDLVIFQDFNYGPYQMSRYLPRIRSYVEDGGAFAMIGGTRSFGAGGYEHTEVAEILPVSMAPGESAVVEGEFSPTVVAELARHPIIELVPDPGENVALWSELAPLVGANRLLAPAAGAQVLLSHPSARGEASAAMPVLVVGNAGKGRTLALGSDSSWRWGITTAGRLGDASAYERFWDRALRWLSRDPLLEPARIDTDRERYGPSAEVKATLSLRDRSYKPLTHRDLVLRVTDLEEEVVSSHPFTSDARGEAELTFPGPSTPGGYRIEVRSPSDDAMVMAEEGFVVEAGGDELADSRPNPRLLEAIARATGGGHYGRDDAPELSQLDRTRSRTLGSIVRAPFSTPWAFIALVVLLGAEWAFRRAFGLR